MSWYVLAGVTDTIYFLNKMACNILGLHVSYCCVCKGCFVCLQSLYCQPLAYCSSQCCGVFWGRTASVKPSSGLKKRVSLSELSEVSLVPAFVTEPYNIVYKFHFFSYLICSILFSSPAPAANPSSQRTSSAWCEPTTAVIQKSSLPFRPVEQHNETPSSSNCWFNLLNTRRIIPSIVFWNRLIRSILIIQIASQSLGLSLWGCVDVVIQVAVALAVSQGTAFDI